MPSPTQYKAFTRPIPVRPFKQQRAFGSFMHSACIPIAGSSTIDKASAPTTPLDNSLSLTMQSHPTWPQITLELRRWLWQAPHFKTRIIWDNPPRRHIGCCFWAPFVLPWHWSRQFFLSVCFQKLNAFKKIGNSGVLKRNLTFFVSTLFSIVGSLLILIGASIWTVLIRRTEAVNNLLIGLPPISVGIVVSSGSGLALTWAAFACMVVSIVPYMIRYGLSTLPRLSKLRPSTAVVPTVDEFNTDAGSSRM